jgi:hypothetical protein
MAGHKAEGATVKLLFSLWAILGLMFSIISLIGFFESGGTTYASFLLPLVYALSMIAGAKWVQSWKD